MESIQIRQASIDDVDQVAPLFDQYRSFYRQEPALDAARSFLTQRLSRDESVLFVAFDRDTAVGFAQLYPSFSSTSLARIYVLNDLFVAESHRNRRIGTRLIEAAVRYAREHDAVRLTLSTRNTNTTAQHLYETTGWIRDDQFVVYNFRL